MLESMRMRVVATTSRTNLFDLNFFIANWESSKLNNRKIKSEQENRISLSVSNELQHVIAVQCFRFGNVSKLFQFVSFLETFIRKLKKALTFVRNWRGKV